jgi:integration host factor subunit beta
MIKSELTNHILAQNRHLYRRDVEKIVNAVIEEIIAAMILGDRVELRGFGMFSVRQRSARDGRNPKNGAVVAVAKKNLPYFRAGKEHARAPQQDDARIATTHSGHVVQSS